MVPDGWLPTHQNHWPTMTSIVLCCYVWRFYFLEPAQVWAIDPSLLLVQYQLPRMWNNLPVHLRDSELTLLEFCWLLKTHLFSFSDWFLVFSALYKCTSLHVTVSWQCTDDVFVAIDRCRKQNSWDCYSSAKWWITWNQRLKLWNCLE